MELVKFFQAGGSFMYPILFVMAIALAIAADRLFYLSKMSRATNKLWTLIVPMLKANDFVRAERAIGESKSPLALVLSYGFARAKPAVKREVVESAMEEGVMEVVPLLEERTHYLATLANVATLLGLLGTIIGLIDAFAVVAEADPAEKADLLSGSISVAMNTTAFGLIVAIPLLLIHSYLATRTSKLIDTIEMAAVKCSNLMVDE
ncbi:MotA/TolQ/ExbB proton channel family protein [Cellvibrio sp. PSBB023]|uniref:MotA/TolQ/ExbB proton channel family protein n=1 Tax=Cellvibrio sp. PSBB023 TaxID=1945512 RepID=UPI00098FFCE8|nr:MotA/TolQ/ExbB proton channel family protein [Cellvibrio sp. PSBB023]AQT61199.1 flagellar motor protein MotA [Cellvibrio sp. PSBB023]